MNWKIVVNDNNIDTYILPTVAGAATHMYYSNTKPELSEANNILFTVTW